MRPSILCLIPRFPVPPFGGAELLQLALVRECSKSFDVDVATTVSDADMRPEGSSLHELARRVHTVPYGRNWSLAVRVRNKLGLGAPEYWQAWDCPAYARLVSGLCRSESYGAVIVNQPFLCGGKWRGAVGSLPALHVIVDILADVHKGDLGSREIAAIGRRERASWARAQVCWALIEPNAEQVRSVCRTFVSPLGYEPDGCEAEPLPKAPSLLMVGSLTYAPNHEGAQWFVQDVLPLIRGRHPGVRLTIAGRGALPEAACWSDPAVELVRDPTELRPLYDRTRIVIVPILRGSGFRVKVVEAMSMGRPIVSTTIGCEGIGLVDGETALIADAPATFADAVCRLLESDELCIRLAGNALGAAADRFTWEKALAPVVAEVNSLVENSQGRVPRTSSRGISYG